MTMLIKLAVLVAFTLCSSFSVAEENKQGISISNTTNSGNNPANTNHSTAAPPYSSGPTLPPIGQNCHTQKICTSVSCTVYDNQGKCTKQECSAWEERFVCKQWSWQYVPEASLGAKAKDMQKLHVIVDDIPATSFWSEWAPIAIAIIALLVSISSVWIMRSAYVRSIRPFVWAMNIFSQTNTNDVVRDSSTVMILVSNSPAHIKSEKHEVYLVKNGETEKLHSSEEKDSIRYPSERSQYTYCISDFANIRTRLTKNAELIRTIRIEYKSLFGGKTYFYESKSHFDASEDVWRILSEKAS